MWTLSRKFAFLLAGLLLGGCSKMQSDQTALSQRDGFVIGDESSSTPALVVGVGDTVPHLLERNPFLRSLNLEAQEPLRLPLLRTTDVTYDDGRWRLKVGCVTTSNLDGDERIAGVKTVGLTLCKPALNDWKEATRRASEIVKSFRSENPSAIDIAEWLKNAKETEWRSVGGNAWVLPIQRQVMTVEDANAYFAKLVDMSSRDAELAGIQEGVSMGIFLGEKAIFEVGVTKQTKWAGDNLTDSQRKDRNYAVTVIFTLRKDVPYP